MISSANDFGIAPGPRFHPQVSPPVNKSAEENLDSAIVSAFYPFAKVTLKETRRQVEAAESFQASEAARREQIKDEARESALNEEASLRRELDQVDTSGAPEPAISSESTDPAATLPTDATADQLQSPAIEPEAPLDIVA